MIKKKLKYIYNSKVIKIIICLIIMLITFKYVYQLNNNTGYLSDDFIYKYIFKGYHMTEEPTEIKNINDLLLSTKNQYNMWGGRIVAQIILQLSMIVDKSIFNVLNTLSFLLLGLLIYLNAIGLGKIKPLYLAFIYLGIWFFVPGFGITLLWVAGSANYLWTMNVMLIFILPYRIYLDNQNDKYNVFKIIFTILLGIISGMCNENTSIAIVILSLLYIIVYKKKGLKIHIWSIVGSISSFIGYVLLIIAPGNVVRSYGNVLPNNLIEVFTRIKTVVIEFIDCSGGLIVIAIGLYIIVFSLYKKKLTITNIYIIACVIGLTVLMASPKAPDRTLFGPFTFLMIATLNVYTCIEFNNKVKNRINTYLLVVALLIFWNQYKYVYLSIKNSYQEDLFVIKQINEQRESGKNQVTINKLPSSINKYNPYYIYNCASENSVAFVGDFMAYYYGVNRIIFRSTY